MFVRYHDGTTNESAEPEHWFAAVVFFALLGIELSHRPLPASAATEEACIRACVAVERIEPLGLPPAIRESKRGPV